MIDFLYRTEDIRSEDILRYFVETHKDEAILNALKRQNPVILVGSRGVGKSFLFRVGEVQLLKELEERRTFPVYVTFNKSTLIHTSDPDQFQHWMLARLCARIVRALNKQGFLTSSAAGTSILTGGQYRLIPGEKTTIEHIVEEFERSWRDPGREVDITGLPSIDAFRDGVEDLCADLDLAGLTLFFDEAAHIFIPQQQREFFTLFRDLRSPYMTCHAAVYPGVTSFGATFQPTHDATVMTLDRDVLADDYIEDMHEIVTAQIEGSTALRRIERHRENFALLAYAANGNPRILFKTLARAPSASSQDVNEVIREYYRTEIWSEHSGLAEKYPGHRVLVDWGRSLIEDEVLPELQSKNDQYLSEGKKTTSFFWIHRDASQYVKEALRLLAYTGIVTEHASGIKATRSEIGTRYAVNLGCLFALESTPTADSKAFRIAKNLTPKRMTEYGANHPAYESLLKSVPEFTEPDMTAVLQRTLEQPIEVLDITEWQKEQLQSMDLHLVGDVLRATESMLQEAHYVGEKRARRMRNAAIAAVYEYLSG